MDYVYFFYMTNGTVITGLVDSARPTQVVLPSVITHTEDGYDVMSLDGTDVVTMNMNQVSMFGLATYGNKLFAYVTYVQDLLANEPQLKEELSKMTTIDFDTLDKQITEFLEENVPEVEEILKDMPDTPDESNKDRPKSNPAIEVPDDILNKALDDFFANDTIQEAVSKVIVSKKYH